VNDRETADHAGATAAEERILAAATEEFASKGFFGARTQAIADVAGLNKAMLHYYYRSKENLYSQVIKKAFQRILTQVLKAWSGEEPLWIRAEEVIDSYLDGFARNPGFIRIMLRELADGGPVLRKVLEELREADLSPLFSPGALIARVSEELGLNRSETIHFVVNLVAMSLFSFISPPILEEIMDFKVSDLELYVQERREAIKSLVIPFIVKRVSGQEEIER